ncbi:GAF domain-containing protein [Sphingomonas sp.]|uniref:GAF domain-containing protein n=1 Tax=Sphingomonas sp. TaxID=28214 RepID=UPI002ED95007
MRYLVMQDSPGPVGANATSREVSSERDKALEPLFSFLDRLSQLASKSASADEILATTTRLTAEHLGLSNCAYADMDEDEDGFTIRGNWHAPNSPSIVGHYSLADFGTLAVQELKAGRPLIINDNLREIAPHEAKTFQDIGIAATICMPLVKAGRLVALMAIHDKAPHYWSDYELEVIQEVTDRSWAHVERVRAEAELRLSNGRFRAAVQATRGVVWTNDPQGRMIGEQPGWAALTGQSLEEYQGHGWATAVHPDDAEPTIQAWNEAVRHCTPFVFEHRVKRSDGAWRLFSVRAIPVLGSDGSITEWVGVHTDVTEERAAADALREETRILEALNETGSGLAAQLDVESIVQSVTDAGVSLTGAQFGAFFYNVIKADGESYMLFTLSGAHRSQFDFGMPRNTAVFHATFAGECIIRSDDITQDARYGHNSPHFGMPAGHLPVVSYLAVPVRSRSGEVIGGLLFGHPEAARFTERHERLIVGIAGQAAVSIDNARLYSAVQQSRETLEQRVQERTTELKQAHDALAQSQKLQALGELTGGIAHDFNNLMTVVSGSAEILLRRGDLSENKRRQYLEGIADTARRATTLTQQLLAFGRRQAIKPQVIDLDASLDSFAKVLERTLGSQIHVSLRLGSHPGRVKVDPTQLETAVLNAAVNARDAMPSGGRIEIVTTVTSGDAQGMICVSIRDEGMGMPQRVIERAFEPFFTTKEVGKGTGLGLSQIHGFAAQAGGRVEIESREGEGTTIHIFLPATEEAAPPQLDERPIARLPRGTRVLLVEDNQQVREFACELLADLGCLVAPAQGASEALSLLETETVDLVLTDVVMPGITGVELARILRERMPGLPVLLATGYSEEILKNEHDFTVLPKPYDAQSLMEAMGAMLSDRKTG